MICWTKKERRVWRCQYVEKHQESHLRLFGLFGGWVICWSIKTNGLKLYRAFNMPFGVILPVLNYGKYVCYAFFDSFSVLLMFFFFLSVVLDFAFKMLMIFFFCLS